MRCIISKLLPIALWLYCMQTIAGNPGVTFLFTNGQKTSFTFDSEPELTVDSNGLTISTSDAATLSFTFADIQRFYFETDVHTSISQTKASIQHPVFNYAGETVTVNGLKQGERISVISTNGNILKRLTANNEGEACINLCSVPSGVYIISVSSGINFKLLKK